MGFIRRGNRGKALTRRQKKWHRFIRELGEKSRKQRSRDRQIKRYLRRLSRHEVACATGTFIISWENPPDILARKMIDEANELIVYNLPSGWTVELDRKRSCWIFVRLPSITERRVSTRAVA